MCGAQGRPCTSNAASGQKLSASQALPGLPRGEYLLAVEEEPQLGKADGSGCAFPHNSGGRGGWGALVLSRCRSSFLFQERPPHWRDVGRPEKMSCLLHEPVLIAKPLTIIFAIVLSWYLARILNVTNVLLGHYTLCLKSLQKPLRSSMTNSHI